MVVATKGFQSDTSTSSELDYSTADDKNVQLLAKQHLKGRLFMGTFQEKRYVDSISSYRDVVSIDKEEIELIKDMLVVKQKVESYCSRDRWIGITTPDMIGAPSSYSVWVELPETTIFGKYWFQIKRIKFNTKEVCLRVEILRSINYETPKTNSENREQNKTSNLDEIFSNIKKDANEKIVDILRNIITIANFKESIVFLCMLLATLTVSLFELLKYICEYLLRFINETSNFMKSVTPVMQVLANLIERIFRNLCMLIAFLLKGGSKIPPQNPYPSVDYAYQNRRALPAPSRRRGVIIEEVE